MGLHIKNGEMDSGCSVFFQIHCVSLVIQSLIPSSMPVLSILGGWHHDGTLVVGRRSWCHSQGLWRWTNGQQSLSLMD